MEVWRTGFPKWGSQGGAVPPHGGRLRYVFYGKASKALFRPRVAVLQGGTPYLLPGASPGKAEADLWLVAGHIFVREWATLNVSHQSLGAGYISVRRTWPAPAEYWLDAGHTVRVGAGKGAYWGMKVWRTGFPKWGSQGGAVPPHGGRLRYVFYGKASKAPFSPRVAGLQSGTPLPLI